LQPNTGVP